KGSVTVTVVQGNIPQRLKWKPEWWEDHLGKYVRLTTAAARENKASLVVWPEDSIPGALTQELYLMSSLSSLAKETDTHLLLGSSVRPNFGPREFRRTNWSNSAFLLSPRR